MEDASIETTNTDAKTSISDEATPAAEPVVGTETNKPAPATVGQSEAGVITPEAAFTDVPAEASLAAPKETWATSGNKSTTLSTVVLGTTYVSPLNDQVTVTFTKLPEKAGTLSIEEITLTPEQVKTLGALSDKAYDITSDMADGTFKYELTLPKEKNAKDVQIKFAEDIAGLKNADTVANNDVKTETDYVSTTLDHFTIFVVADPSTDPVCVGNTCYATIKAAIDNGLTLPGDTINVTAGTYTENLTVNKSLTLLGVGDTTIINGEVEATGDNVTIQNLRITNSYPHPGYGIKATAGKSLTLESVQVDVLHDGVYMKSKDLTNVTTITINSSDITGYSAIELADPTSTYNDNNAAINVNISNTSLTGTTSYGGASNDYQTIGMDYTNNVHINFTGTNSVKNEYTDGATSRERLVWFWYSNNNSITGTVPTYTNGTGSTVSDDALFMSSNDDSNTVQGQVVARYVMDATEFEAALASVSITPIVVGGENAAFSTTQDNTLKTGVKLIIEAGTPVTIEAGETFTNNGTIVIEPGATFTNNGVINGSGTISKTVDLSVTPQDVTVGDLTINDVTGTGSLSVIKYAGAPPTGALSTGVDGYYYDIQYTGALTFPVSIEINYDNSFDENHFSSLYYYNSTWKDYKLDTVGTTGYAPSTVSIDKSANKITASLQHLTPIVPATDTTAPTVPTNGAPNGTHIPTNNFDFTWDDSTDASTVTYEYQTTMDSTEVGGVLTNSPWNSLANGITLSTPTIHSAGASDGTWYWQVRAMDSFGNTSAWSSIWDVTIDTHVPVITRLGSSPVDVAYGSTYVDAGATCVDNIDPTCTVTPGGLPINTSVVGGPLTVTYDAVDTAGNNATQVTRTVNVIQATSTVIVTCTAGAPYTYTGSAQTPCTAQATGDGMAPVDVTASIVYGNNTNAGSATANANWGGDANHTGNTGSGGFTINKANASVVVTLYTVTYDDAPHTATVTSITGVNSETNATVGTVDVSNTTHTVAGTYASDLWSFTGAANYNNITATTITDTIDKATPTATLAVSNSPQDYTGAAQSAAVDISASSVPGAVQNILTGGAATQTDAATYAVTANFVPTDTTNYNTLTALGAGNFVINKVTQATLITTAQTVTYPAAFAALATTGGLGGGAVTFALTDAGTAGCSVSGTTLSYTTAGTCTVTATKAADVNYLEASSVAQTFTVDKAASLTVITCPGSGQVYTGVAQMPCTVSVTGANLSLTPDPVYTSNINFGTAGASYTYAGDANHTGSTDSKTFSITKANPTIVVTPYSVTYDGNPHTAIGTAKGVLNEDLVGLVVTSTTHTNADDYPADAWVYTDVTGNYNDASGTVHDVISQASSTTTVTCPGSGQVYTGLAQTPCTVSVTGVGGLSLTPDPIYTSNTNVGTAGASYSFAGDINHTGSSDSKTFTIDKAGLTVTADDITNEYGDSDPTFTFVYIGFVGGENSSVIDTPPTCSVPVSHDNRGTYTIVCSGGIDNNYSFSYVDGTLKVKDTNDPDNVDNLDANYQSLFSRIRLTWDVNDSDIYKVYIYRGKSKNFHVNASSRIAENDRNDTDYSDYKIVLGEKYYYKVLTIDKAGNKSNVRIISVLVPTKGTTAIVTNEGTEQSPVETSTGNETSAVGSESGTNGGTNTGGGEGQSISGNQEGGQVLGEQTTGQQSGFWKTNWMWILLIFLAGSGLYYVVRRNRNFHR